MSTTDTRGVAEVMRSRRVTAWAQTAGRAANAGFFLFTSVYCLLTYSPFAYEQFIQPHVIAWLSNFVLLYADFYWLALCVTALTLVPWLRLAQTRIAAWSYLAVGTGLGLAIMRRSVLPGGDSPLRSVGTALAALIPLFWLAAIDRAGARALEAARSGDRGASGRADVPARQDVCFATAVFVWAVFAVLAIARLRGDSGAESSGALAFGVAMSAAAHLTVFALLYLVLAAITSVTAGSWRPHAVAARFVLWCAGAAVVLQRVVFTPISIGGPVSWAIAAALGAAIVASISGMVRLHEDRRPSRLGAALLLLVLPAIAFGILRVVTPFDWGFMLQKLTALAVASVAFTAIGVLAAARPVGAIERRRFALPAAAMAMVATGAVAAPRLSTWAGTPRLDAGFALDAYSAGDPSFRLIQQFLERTQVLQRDADFFSFLRANASIEEPLAPVDIDFATRLEPPPARPPDLFLFVIDSLRRDYVSPYNAAVTFTPALDAFARESAVFERAFTRYGGTGLAVPSIWAGAMLIHKQYVTPFAPTNALAKLLDAEGYRRAVTFDHITDELFGFPNGSTTLDRAIPEMTHRFCRTVDEIEADLEVHADDPRPVFVHTRPLGLHIGNTRFADVPQGEAYPGFFGPYASRVHRIDSCFGEFVAFLKRTRRYENSIVIVLADHGDSLGEGLRWGHGYTVFPEVIRIPLMIHVPPAMRGRFTADPARVAFSTDVTPTLYQLLGYAPARPREAAGSPLFADAGARLTDRRSEPFLIASSYGAVFGLVRQNGRRLYIADAIEGRDYLFDLAPTGPDTRIALTDSERVESRAIIREQVADLAAWYGRQ